MTNNGPSDTGWEVDAGGQTLFITPWAKDYPAKAWYEGFGRQQGYVWSNFPGEIQPAIVPTQPGVTRYPTLQGATPADLNSLYSTYPEMLDSWYGAHPIGPPPPGWSWWVYGGAAAAAATVGIIAAIKL